MIFQSMNVGMSNTLSLKKQRFQSGHKNIEIRTFSFFCIHWFVEHYPIFNRDMTQLAPKHIKSACF